MQSMRLAPSDSRKNATSPSPQPTSSTGELPIRPRNFSTSPPRKPSSVSIAPRDAQGYHIAPVSGLASLSDLSRSWYWLPRARSLVCGSCEFFMISLRGNARLPFIAAKPRVTDRRRGSETGERHDSAQIDRSRPVTHLHAMDSCINSHATERAVYFEDRSAPRIDARLPTRKERFADNDYPFASHVRFQYEPRGAAFENPYPIGAVAALQSRRRARHKRLASQVRRFEAL